MSNTEAQANPPGSSTPKRSWLERLWRGAWRFMKGLVLGLVVLLLALWLILRIPAVQNYLADTAAAYLAGELETKVEIGTVDIRLFSQVRLNELYIEDQQEDTLLYARHLGVYIGDWGIFPPRLELSMLDLDEAVFNYRREGGEWDFNLYFILDYFAGPKKTEEDKPQNPSKFKLSIKSLRLHNLRFNYYDGLYGTDLQVFAQQGLVDARQMDLVGKYIEADSVKLNQAEVHIRTFKGQPLAKPRTVALSDSSFKATITPVQDTLQPRWNLWVDKLRLQDSKFRLQNDHVGPNPSKPLDFADMRLSELNLSIDSFALYRECFSGAVRDISAQDYRGFTLSSLEGHATVSPQRLEVKGLRLRTPGSDIGDYLLFKYQGYSAFFDFVNQVEMDIQLRDARLRIEDLLAFAHPLNEVAFFKDNSKEQALISGHARGRINDLRGDAIKLSMGTYSSVEGNIQLKDITYPDKAKMSFALSRLTSHHADLQRFMPKVVWPKQLARAGLFSFVGKFEGFKQFEAAGQLNSALGQILADLRMDLRQGLDLATYQGRVAITDFDLGLLLNQSQLGKASLSAGIIGKGLTLASLDAHLDSARIQHLRYYGGYDSSFYDYKDIFIHGDFEQQRFIGLVLSADPNCDFSAQGRIDFNTEVPELDIWGAIHKLDFQALKLQKDSLSFALDTFLIQGRGRSVDDFEAKLDFECFSFIKGEQGYYFDSLRIFVQDSLLPSLAQIDSFESGRYLKIDSDIIQGEVVGVFDFVNLPRSVLRYAKRNYPNFYQQLSQDSLTLAEQDSLLLQEDSLALLRLKEQRLDFSLSIDSFKRLGYLLTPDLHRISGLKLQGHYDSYRDSLSVIGSFDTLQYANVNIVRDSLLVGGKGSIFNLSNTISRTVFGDSTILPSISLELSALQDSLSFMVNVKEIGKVASDIAIGGMVLFSPESLDARLQSSNLTILGQRWSINENNRISFYKDSFRVEGVKLTNGEQRIQLNSFKRRGLRLRVDFMDLGWIYNLSPIPAIDLSGHFSAILTVQDIYKQRDLRADVFIDSLGINGDNWGYSRLEVEADSIKSPIRLLFRHGSNMADTIWAKGQFIPAFAAKTPKERNRFDLEFEIYQAQARILEYFLKAQIRETEGLLTASGKLIGEVHPLRGGLDYPVMRWNILGIGVMNNIGTTVNMLNTRYRIPHARLTLNNKGFYIEPRNESGQRPAGELCDPNIRLGVPIFDQEGRQGRILGAITHDHFNDFGLDFRLCLNNTLVMNTTEVDNQTFYGTVYADGDAHFHGPFNKLKLDIDAKTRENTILVLPMGSAKDIERNELIVFVDKVAQRQAAKDSAKLEKPKTEGGGLDLSMRIEVTPQATAQIVLDPQTGDVISGQGRGNLLVTYNSSGEFGMVGQYEITKGQYLFTYQNLVNKTFTVQPGGSIVWSGDPFEAELNIQAVYQQRASLRNLLNLYITDEATRRLADQRTPVDLLMNISGQLFSPDINFDIAIPKVEPNLRSSTDLALRAVRQDKNELNRQVFALILLQQFLPLENSGARGQNQVNLVSSGANTLSELLSKQLSSYLTDIFSQVMDEVEFIDNFEVDVDFKMQEGQNLDNPNRSNSELALGLDQSFANNRLRVRIGANMDLGNNMGNIQGANQNYIGGDFVIEYLLTEDGSFKLRAYNRTESTILGRLMRSGIGISYRKEFDDWGELAKAFKSYFGRESRKKRREARRNRKKNQTTEELPLTKE